MTWQTLDIEAKRIILISIFSLVTATPLLVFTFFVLILENDFLYFDDNINFFILIFNVIINFSLIIGSIMFISHTLKHNNWTNRDNIIVCFYVMIIILKICSFIGCVIDIKNNMNELPKLVLYADFTYLIINSCYIVTGVTMQTVVLIKKCIIKIKQKMNEYNGFQNLQ